METVFFSFASKSASDVAVLQAVLEALGAECINYRLPNEHSAVDKDTIRKLRDQVARSTFFIQLLDGSVGIPVAIENAKPILALEKEWYCKLRVEPDRTLPPPLILSYNPMTSGEERERFDRYVAELETDGIGLEYPPNIHTAIKVVVGWFTRHRFFFSERYILDGMLDTEIHQPSIKEAFDRAIVHGSRFPQKYLYTSPVGATLWKNVMESNEGNTKKLYETIHYRDTTLKGMKKILAMIISLPPSTPISIIALGCGEGKRECEIVKAISRGANPQREVRVLLVDISKTLIAKAASWFAQQTYGAENVNPSISFALADFEHPQSIVGVMRRWKQGLPCISILLGNTLGNIDSATFIQTISAAMERDDLLAVEIVIANDAEKASAVASKASLVPVKPQRDENFEFICGPLRSLGIHPDPARFRVQTTLDEWAVSRVYSYQLNEDDIRKISPLIGKTTVKNTNLRLIKVDAFDLDKLADLYGKADSLSISPSEEDVYECKKVSREGKPTRVGFFVAQRS